MNKELHIRPKDSFCPVLRGCLALRNISELSLKKLLMTGNRKSPRGETKRRVSSEKQPDVALWTNTARLLSPHFIFPEAERPSCDGAGSIIQKGFQTTARKSLLVRLSSLQFNSATHHHPSSHGSVCLCVRHVLPELRVWGGDSVRLAASEVKTTMFGTSI